MMDEKFNQLVELLQALLQQRDLDEPEVLEIHAALTHLTEAWEMWVDRKLAEADFFRANEEAALISGGTEALADARERIYDQVRKRMAAYNLMPKSKLIH